MELTSEEERRRRRSTSSFSFSVFIYLFIYLKPFIIKISSNGRDSRSRGRLALEEDDVGSIDRSGEEELFL